MLLVLTLSVAASPSRTQMRTYGAKEHEAGEGNGPGVLRVDHVATIELGKELALNTQRVNAAPNEELTKSPSASQLHSVSIAFGITLSAVGGNHYLVSPWPRRQYTVDTGELAVIDVRNGKNVEVHPGLYGRSREHDRGIGYKPPLDTIPSAVVGVKQCGHTLEEQYDYHS